MFKDQRGEVLADSFRQPSITNSQNTTKRIKDQIPDLDIDADTCVPLTMAGERMDWGLAVGHLFV